MMNEELMNEAMETVTEAVETAAIPDVVPGRGFNKNVAIVGGVLTTIGVGAVTLWKNRKKIAAHFEKKQIAKFEKKGYQVCKLVEDSEGVKAVPVNTEESK